MWRRPFRGHFGQCQDHIGVFTSCRYNQTDSFVDTCPDYVLVNVFLTLPEKLSNKMNKKKRNSIGNSSYASFVVEVSLADGTQFLNVPELLVSK